MCLLNLKTLGGRKPKPPEYRFHNSYIPEPNSGCWLWFGGEKGSNKYGSLKVDGRPFVAHRYSFVIHKGQIPDGLLVLHHCDNPACVNPDHLFLGTHQENMADMTRKGRQARGPSLAKAQQNFLRRGEKNAMHKVTDAQREEIKGSGLSQRVLARIYGITQTGIWRIKHG